MNELYPSVESMSALTVFQLYEGSGEWFDLSKKPIERAGFTFGGGKDNQERYFVTDKCIGQSRGSQGRGRPAPCRSCCPRWPR